MYLLIFDNEGKSHPHRVTIDAKREVEQIARDGTWTNFPKGYRAFIPAHAIARIQIVDDSLEDDDDDDDDDRSW